MDFFYVNVVMSLNKRSGKINLRYVQACVSRTKGKIMKGLETLKKDYDTRGFNIKAYNGENDFNIQSLDKALLTGLLSICTRKKT